MAERGKAGGRTRTWPPEIAAWRGRTAGFAGDLARLSQAASGRLRQWAIADTGPGRLMPWLPVAFGAGIVLYFTADHEPTWWAGVALTLACVVSAWLLRARPVAFPVALGVAAVAAGFATATLKTQHVAHPVLTYPVSGVEISGFVEMRESRARSDRIVIRVQRIEAARLNVRLERVRLSVRKGTAPIVGSYVTLKARLTPPLQPLRPGSYDFARDMYFQQIGASGFVLGAIKAGEAPAAPRFWTRYAAAISAMREVVDSRIRATIPGDNAAIASALLTGTRDAISAPVNDAMYVSSLAHVLSISGYHMAVVAGVVFFAIRAALALIPAFASRYPIKKWAAVAALLAATFYLLLSGAEVATLRSYIMTAIVLIGVMFDRATLTFRTIAVAALAVLLVSPEAVVHPSFQMSFAATLALISGYQHGLPWFAADRETPFGARVALWGGREITGLVLASLLAGCATMPYAAFHFHRLAPYGLLANLAAMPVVSAVVMPAGMLGVLAIPFGFDGVFWRIMAAGIEWMIAVVLWVANLPGAVGRVASFDTGPLLLCSAGLIVLCLLRTPLRWAGAALVVFASLWAMQSPRPDVLVSADGSAVAVRGAAGRLSILKRGSDDFAVHEWLAADADARNSGDPTLSEGVACDQAGCVGKLADGALVALSLGVEAFEEDCRRAAIVVSPHQAPADCGTTLVDRPVWRAGGAIALRQSGAKFDMIRARPAGTGRPWAPEIFTSSGETAPASRTTTRDATPRAEDLEPSD